MIYKKCEAEIIDTARFGTNCGCKIEEIKIIKVKALVIFFYLIHRIK